MLFYVLNSFQREWGVTIDGPFTKQLRDRILNKEQEKLDALTAQGALIGTPRICARPSSAPIFWIVDSIDSTSPNSGTSCSPSAACTAAVTCVISGKVIVVFLPAIELSPGGSIELDIPLSVTRYQLYVGGKEICMVDKLAGICRINGTDYAEQVNALL